MPKSLIVRHQRTLTPLSKPCQNVVAPRFRWTAIGPSAIRRGAREDGGRRRRCCAILREQSKQRPRRPSDRNDGRVETPDSVWRLESQAPWRRDDRGPSVRRNNRPRHRFERQAECPRLPIGELIIGTEQQRREAVVAPRQPRGQKPLVPVRGRLQDDLPH